MRGKVWYEITYPFPTVEVLEWIKKFSLHFKMDVMI